MMDVRQETIAAESRIREHVRTTPVERSPFLEAAVGARVFLKLENLQRTGSFKLRGALNKLFSLSPDERAAGVVAASTGNHGAAVACGASEAGCRAVVVAPESAAGSKIEAIRIYGAEVRFAGTDCVVAEKEARDYADRNGMTYVSPYNDPKVIGGQGTIGLELERQMSKVDAIFVSLGGGGLIGGIGGYLKAIGKQVEVVACSPENSPVMHESLLAGRIVCRESKPTLSDGTAGGVERGAITFDLCREVVDESVLVGEEEIRQAVRLVLERHHVLVEGAAGVAVAGLLKQQRRFAGRDVAVVLCGANIDIEVLRTIL